MMSDGLKLTVYIGDRDQLDGGRLQADALMELFARAGLRTSVLLRGIEGFGIRHRLQTERLLTRSEDLPVLAVALDARERIEGVLAEVQRICRHGAVTLERVALSEDAAGAQASKLTILTSRQQRAGGRPAHVTLAECLSRHGLDGAVTLLGLDGTIDATRRRARLLSANRDVPTMTIAVGEAAPARAALAELRELLPGAPIALERVRVCKRDGRLLDAPADAGAAGWRKLALHTGGRARHGQEPLHSALLGRLRAAGAAGATTLRGLYGYRGCEPPHGERQWSLARHAPLMTVVLDTPQNTARWFAAIDELTGGEEGLVTCEEVPAMRSAGPGIAEGSLELSH